MTAVYIILAIVILALILLLSSKIKLFFEYKKYPGEKLYTDISIHLGFINLSRFIKAPKEDKLTQKTKDIFTTDKIKNYVKTFKILTKVYSKNRLKIQKSLVIEKVNIHIKFGLFDAMQTGIMTGALWSLLYSALALADSVGTVKKHFFEVAPVYTEPGFISEGRVKLSVRLISALILGVRLYTTYKKTVKENN